jgi:hypothetical protein
VDAWLKAGEVFPETSGFMTPTQVQVICTNDYKKYISKDPTNDTCTKCWEKSETTQHVTSAWHAQTEGDYTHCHNQGGNVVHQMWTVKGKSDTIL